MLRKSRKNQRNRQDAHQRIGACAWAWAVLINQLLQFTSGITTLR